MKQAVIAIAFLLIGGAGAFLYLKVGRSSPAADMCSKHQMAEAQCPWCRPELVAELGHCKGHDVPEAYCSRCNPALIPGFKAENDWCAGHGLPESQCRLCLAGNLPPGEEPR